MRSLRSSTYVWLSWNDSSCSPTNSKVKKENRTASISVHIHRKNAIGYPGLLTCVLDWSWSIRMKDVTIIAIESRAPVPVYNVNRKKYFVFLIPTQLLIHGQWWSIFKIQTLHSEQWWALIGFHFKLHFLHPFTSSSGKSSGGETSDVITPGSTKEALTWATDVKYPSELNITNITVPMCVHGIKLISLLLMSGSANQ